jgi:hypothetical protein
MIQTYYRRINNRDVWVSVHQPRVFAGTGRSVPARGYCAAFRLLRSGECTIDQFLWADGDFHWFTTDEAAARAAFDEAERQIKAGLCG